MGTKLVGDHLSRWTKFWGPFVYGDCLSSGTNFMGIICPVGQKVGDRKSGDQMSRSQVADTITAFALAVMTFGVCFNPIP